MTNQNGTVMSYIKDSHGSVIRTAYINGNAMQEAEYRADYDAFGRGYQGSRNTPFGYSGEYVDSESGNVYLRNRYYDSSIGRFITEDPAQDGLNWYVYAGNNPVSFVDPWGLSITLSVTEDEMEKSFAQLQALTDDELTYDAETGVVTIAKSVSDGEKVQGTKMIADLIANQDFDVKIERVSIENYGCYIYYNDAGATIQMNDWDEEGGNWGYMVSDGDGGSVWEDHASVAYIGSMQYTI